jgi:hypothetical protein
LDEISRENNGLKEEITNKEREMMGIRVTFDKMEKDYRAACNEIRRLD